MYSVRTSTDPEELDRIAPVYLAACADEAVTAWATAGHDFTALFRDWSAQALGEHEVVLAERGDGVVVGVSTWMALESAEPLRRQAGALAEQAAANPALRRVAAAAAVAAALPHPDVPHVYLASMGVVPESRGRGVGSAILRHRLALADARRLPVRLEASTPRSAALYARHGFTPTGSPIALPDHGPLLHPLQRLPRQRASPTFATHVSNPQDP